MLPVVSAGMKAIQIAKANPVINFLIRLGILGVVAIGSYYLIRTMVRKWSTERNLKKETKNAGTTDRAGKINLIAQLFRQGFFPLGEPRWGHIFWDGTDEKHVWKAAALMHKHGISMSEVAPSYKAMNPHNDLLTDLQRELDGDQLAKFYDILQGGTLNGLTFQKKAWTYRTTPVLNQQLKPVGKFRPGAVIGNTTEMLVTPSGKTYVSFYRKGQQLFVNAADVKQKQTAA